MSDLVDRLKAACVGHPDAKIPWPHRLLHEAADELTALRARVKDYEHMLAAAPSPEWVKVSERLQAIHSALDESLGDSDIDWIETDEEIREEEPVQWAATELAKLIHELEPRQQPPAPPGGE